MLLLPRSFGNNLTWTIFQNKVPMAIATGSIKSVHEQKTRPHDKFFSVFELVVTSEDEEVKIGKPAPDIYSVCTSRFAGNISPGSCLAFEDAPNGVASARAAGMPVVMVPGPWIEAGDLTKNATLLLKDLRDFDPSSFGLPAFGYRREVTHVIFDMDDTLVDSVHRYSAALRKLMGKHGVLQKFTGSGSDRIASFRASIVGQPADVAIPKLVKHFQLEVTAEELLAEFDREALEVLPQSKPLPGVERLVKHLHERGIPMAVATSTTRARYEATSRNLKHLFSLFSHVVTMDDPEMGQPKPAPDIFLLASKRFSDPPADPKRCLVFEDAVSGAEGAAAGGMQCVLVPERNNMTPENSVWGTQLLQTMEEFRPEDFGLPEFSS